MRNGFDFLAPFYDILAGIVFGKTIKRSQIAFLTQIRPGDNILLLGGGTGWILTELFQAENNIKVTYVDSSRSMIQLAKQKLDKDNMDKVEFINASYRNIELKEKYRIVFTPFFLDMFDLEEVQHILARFKDVLSSDGIWLVADFTNSKSLTNTMLLKIMYQFFRNLCGIKAEKLVNFDLIFKEMGFKKEMKGEYYNQMIQSVAYYI